MLELESTSGNTIESVSSSVSGQALLDRQVQNPNESNEEEMK